ncbi:MAG: FxLYD domain-containing protein [Candidatus Omnitrophota bacterium]
MIFPTYEVQFEKSGFDESVVVTGDIKNDSSRDYNMAMFKIVLYSRHKLVGSGVIKVYDFKRDMTKPFRAYVAMDTAVKITAIDRYEIMIEGGY